MDDPVADVLKNSKFHPRIIMAQLESIVSYAKDVIRKVALGEMNVTRATRLNKFADHLISGMTKLEEEELNEFIDLCCNTNSPSAQAHISELFRIPGWKQIFDMQTSDFHIAFTKFSRGFDLTTAHRELKRLCDKHMVATLEEKSLESKTISHWFPNRPKYVPGESGKELDFEEKADPEDHQIQHNEAIFYNIKQIYDRRKNLSHRFRDIY